MAIADIWRSKRKSDHGVIKAIPEPAYIRAEGFVLLV